MDKEGQGEIRKGQGMTRRYKGRARKDKEIMLQCFDTIPRKIGKEISPYWLIRHNIEKQGGFLQGIFPILSPITSNLLKCIF